MTAGSIKFDARLPEDFPLQLEKLKSKFSKRKVLLAASTHEGEEAVLIDAFKQFKHTEYVLVLALRHTRRVTAVEAKIREMGCSYQLHSSGAELQPGTEIYVVDTMGELINFYGVCESAFVGGSLVDVGGHNPMEPAILGKPIMMGPYRRNIADIAELFEERGALAAVQNAKDIVAFWERSLDPELVKTMSESALEVVDRNKGALQLVVREIIPAIDS